MRTVIPIGGSVRLVPLQEIARGLCLPETEALILMVRLKVPVRRDYGPEPVLNLATLEAAIFRDMWIHGDKDEKTIRLYQLQAAIDFGVLDRNALQRLLRKCTAELYKTYEQAKQKRDGPSAEAEGAPGESPLENARSFTIASRRAREDEALHSRNPR